MKSSIINLNNFVLGYNFNKVTIMDDINTSIDLLKSNSSYYMLNDLRNNLFNYLTLRANESINFIDFIYNNNIDNNVVVYELYEKYNLPFINSRYSLADQKLLAKLYGFDNIKLHEAIYYLACFKDKKFIQRRDIKEMLQKCLDFGGIDFNDIGYSSKLNKMDKFDESDEDIESNMDSLRINPSIKYHNRIVAHYAEFVVYKRLLENLGKDQKLFWVSRDIGDGFGYDIAVVNSDNSATVYEVKGLYDRDFADYTGHESRIFHYCYEKPYLDYHFILVLTKNNDAIIDIHKCKNGSIMYEFYGNNNIDAELYEKSMKILVKK